MRITALKQSSLGSSHAYLPTHLFHAGAKRIDLAGVGVAEGVDRAVALGKSGGKVAFKVVDLVDVRCLQLCILACECVPRFRGLSCATTTPGVLGWTPNLLRDIPCTAASMFFPREKTQPGFSYMHVYQELDDGVC